jgi:hypothetical protein
MSDDRAKEGTVFRIGTTHFAWTPDGKADDIQRNDLKTLWECLGLLEDFVLAAILVLRVETSCSR